MTRPIKFRIKVPRIKIINRCLFCGRPLTSGNICNNCAKKMKVKI